MTRRERFRSRSNNAENANQNVCTQRVCDWFGASTGVRYLHTLNDVVRAIRQHYTVRSRFSQVRGKSVGGSRPILQRITESEPGPVLGYVASVAGHVLLLDPSGRTIVDTAARKRDRRSLKALYVVYSKGSR